MGCASAKAKGVSFEDKKKALEAFLGEENSHTFQTAQGNEAAKKVATSNVVTLTVGPEGNSKFGEFKSLESMLEWTDFLAEWTVPDWKVNWMVDGPQNMIIYQTHYTPKFKGTGKQAPTMEDLMLASIDGGKVSRMKYYWSNPGAVTNMMTSEGLVQKLGHLFHHESSAPFLNLNPDPEVASNFGPKEVALRNLLSAWREGKLDRSAEGSAEKAAELCTDNINIVVVGPTGPQYKTYEGPDGLIEWFTFQSKEESHNWKILWMVNGPDTVICQVKYTAKVKETQVTCQTVEDIIVAKINVDKVSHLQYYWGDVSETSKLHPVD